jgi:type IV pilus assembly protein PilB
MPEARQMIGEILEMMGCVSQEDIRNALEAQQATGKKIGEILVEQSVVSDIDVTRALAEQFEIEMVDIEGMDIAREVIEMVDRDKAQELNIIPIDMNDGVLTVAMSDPLDLFTLDNLRFTINCPVECVLATADAIKRALTKYYGLSEDQVGEMLQQFTEEIDVVPTGQELADQEAEGDDAPVIRLVTMIILEAVKARASDIHVEPLSSRLRIRYRIDGVCYEVESPPLRLTSAIISRIKIMSGMDMAEKRRPQDGRIPLTLLGRKLDMRVSSLPATHGESMVLRILDKASLTLGLSDLGFHPDDYKVFRSMIRKPNGIILVTGPTGSGKTTTLYSALNELNRPDTKIITAEDPVEYHLNGINQCQVNRLTGMTFQRIIRAMLRQAPEVILVGEIRDHETAEIAIQAALTGHLVFSTLHTNDAPGALTRLIDLGVAPFLVASSIQAVMGQRLVRIICEECKEPFEPDLKALKSTGLTDQQIAGRTFYQGKGCDACRNVGFKGRKGIFEVMAMNSVIREMTFTRASTDRLRKQAVADGMHTLLMDGMRKVLEGITTADEVLAEAKSLD